MKYRETEGIKVNKSHAAGYAVLSYRTAYLKANYFFEYATAVLKSVETNRAKLSSYAEIVQRNGVEILFPDINKSDVHMAIFDFENKIMSTGFLAIKDVGEGIAANIVAERNKNGLFTDFESFLKRMIPYGIDRKNVMALIYAGAFDFCCENHVKLVRIYENKEDRIRKFMELEGSGQGNIYKIPEFAQMLGYLEEEINDDDFTYDEKYKLMCEYNLVGIPEGLKKIYTDIKYNLESKYARRGKDGKPIPNPKDDGTKVGTVTGILLSDFEISKKGKAYLSTMKSFGGEEFKVILVKSKVDNILNGEDVNLLKKGMVVDIKGQYKLPLEEEDDQQPDEGENGDTMEKQEAIVFPDKIIIKSPNDINSSASIEIDMERRIYPEEMTYNYFGTDEIPEILRKTFSIKSEKGREIFIKYKNNMYSYGQGDQQFNVSLDAIKKLGFAYKEIEKKDR